MDGRPRVRYIHWLNLEKEKKGKYFSWSKREYKSDDFEMRGGDIINQTHQALSINYQWASVWSSTSSCIEQLPLVVTCILWIVEHAHDLFSLSIHDSGQIYSKAELMIHWRLNQNIHFTCRIDDIGKIIVQTSWDSFVDDKINSSCRDSTRIFNIWSYDDEELMSILYLPLEPRMWEVLGSIGRHSQARRAWEMPFTVVA